MTLALMTEAKVHRCGGDLDGAVAAFRRGACNCTQ